MTIPSNIANKAAAELKHDQLTRQAQAFVAQTFFGQMLKQMRDSPFRFRPVRWWPGGQDVRLAAGPAPCRPDGARAAVPLVKSIVRRLERISNVKGPTDKTIGNTNSITR